MFNKKLEQRIDEIEATMELQAECFENILERVEKLEQAIYDIQLGVNKGMKKQLDEHEERIDALAELTKPLVEKRLSNTLNDITTTLENELKDLFGGECKKGAEKCKKCGESAKTTKKTSKKEK